METEAAAGQRAGKIRPRRVVVLSLVLVVLLMIALTGAAAYSEEACYKVNSSARGYNRAWDWTPLPHYKCSYGDGTTRNFWPWDLARHWKGPPD